MSRYPALRAVLPADHERACHCAEVLKAVAHPLRLRIVAILCRGEEHVNALASRLGGLFAGGAALGRLDHALVGSREGSGRLDAPASRALNFAHGGSDMAPSARCDCLVHGDAEWVRQRLCRGILSHDRLLERRGSSGLRLERGRRE